MLETIRKKHAWRQRLMIECRMSCSIFFQGKPLINLASNDYLNLSQHPKVKEAFAKAAKRYGLGSGASALVTGWHQPHFALEEKFSDFLQRRSLLFNSGYHANLAIFQTLAKRSSFIFSDKQCHASLLDGIQLSRAKHRRFPHQDFNFLTESLGQCDAKKKIVVTESVFSTSGDLTALSKLVTICHQKKSLLFLDDAHGLGVLGDHGRGATEYFRLVADEIFCLSQPLGKALGSMGAIVSGKSDVIELLIQQSRPYRYSTALPPAVASATLVALECLEKEPWRRFQLKEHICLFNQLAQQYQLPLLSWDQTPIRSLLLGSNKRALACQAFLQDRGYLAACIRPSTVPENKALIRFSLSSELTKENIEQLVGHLTQFLKYDPLH